MPTALRVLIVENSEDDAQLLLQALRHGGYEPTWQRVAAPRAMTQALEQGSCDLVLSDIAMPQFTGADALELVGESGDDR